MTKTPFTTALCSKPAVLETSQEPNNGVRLAVPGLIKSSWLGGRGGGTAAGWVEVEVVLVVLVVGGG